MYPVDMHLHTSHYSMCGHQTIEELITTAVERGLHAACVTEHSFRWSDEDLAKVVRRLGLQEKITVLGGEEVSCRAKDDTRQGDYLVFGLPHLDVQDAPDVRDLIEEVHARGGIVIAAHPMRQGYNSDRIVYELDLDALEVYNKNHGPEEQEKARECVRATGVLAVGNSDAHRVEHVGMYRTYFAEPVRSIEGLVRQIKARQVSLEDSISLPQAAG